MSLQIQDILTNSPIANRIKPEKLNPIANRITNRQLDSDEVDLLLQNYSDLIAPSYTGWFAKRFYSMPLELVQRCASEARQDSRQNPQRLFAFLIKKRSK